MPRKKAVTIAQERVGIRLSSHEKLCAERMEHIKASIERLDKKVSQLSESVNKGRGAVAALVFIGSIIAGIIGFFSFK
tara:strand:+ start:84 stop:317 length:234 start_codon:yes stop_codon:yes gene_type:complete